MNGQKQRNDTHFTLEGRRTVWWDAETGEGGGDFQANSFPTDSSANPDFDAISFLQNTNVEAGELICWAVDADNGRPISWNFLSGNADLVQTGAGAGQYGAYAFRANGSPGQLLRNAQRLKLNNAVYDRCPKYLQGQFSPTGAPVPGGGTYATQLTAVSCTQDLRQDYELILTKLRFDVWNSAGTKFTGAYECADSWHEVLLSKGSIKDTGFPWTGVDVNGSNFHFSSLKTDTASYRVTGVKSRSCDGPANTSQAVGLLGVQVNLIDNAGSQSLRSATSLMGFEEQSGAILIDPAD
jgi:hypothetical protein